MLLKLNERRLPNRHDKNPFCFYKDKKAQHNIELFLLKTDNKLIITIVYLNN